MADSLAARISRVLAFSGLYVFVDAILERERGRRELWHPLAAGTLAGAGFGLSMRRPLVGLTGGVAVGALAVPFAYSLHDRMGRPTFWQLLRHLDERDKEAKRAAAAAAAADAAAAAAATAPGDAPGARVGDATGVAPDAQQHAAAAAASPQPAAAGLTAGAGPEVTPALGGGSVGQHAASNAAVPRAGGGG